MLALYQWQATGLDPAEIGRHFFDDPAWMDVVADALGELNGSKKPAEAAEAVYDLALFQELLHGVPEQLDKLDSELRSVLDRPIGLTGVGVGGSQEEVSFAVLRRSG